MDIEQVTVTPEMAKAWLGQNTGNFRRATSRTIDAYAADMAAGRWDLNGESIKFHPDGQLVDGQHRLLACIKAQTPFTTIVMWGVTESRNLDRQRKRRLADYLRHMNETNATNLAAAINVGYKWEQGVYDTGRDDVNPTMDQALDWLDVHPGIRDSSRFVYRFTAPPTRITSAVLAPFHLRVSEKMPVDAEEFFEGLGRAHGHAEGSPVLALRQWFLNQATSSHSEPSQRYKLAICILAWNHYLSDQTVLRGLRWRRFGAARSDFPVLRFDGGDDLNQQGETNGN